MPGNFFNISRYFGKQKQDDQNPSSTDERVVTQNTQTMTSSVRPVNFTGIGSPPGYNSQSNQQTVSQNGIMRSSQAGGGFLNATSSQTSTKIDMGKRVGLDVMTRLTQRSNNALMAGVKKAKDLGLATADTEHILYGLLSDSAVYQLLSEMKVVPSQIQAELEERFKQMGLQGPGSVERNPAQMRTMGGQPQFSPRVKRVLELSLSAARSLGYEFISPEHILLALASEGEGAAAGILKKYNITVESLNQKITGKKTEGKDGEEKQTGALDQFAEDLTKKARDGVLDPVVGRSSEIERMIHILSRRTKNNPVLIGDAGVGKTAIVEGLALKIAHGDVPESLLHKRILSLDLMSIVAGAAHRGEFEERLKNVIKEVKASSGGIILFIDEIHNMVGAGSSGEGGMDASNILKPSLARGELQAIGTTTIAEYRKYIEKDPALERRFQPVLVNEPTLEVSIEMLRALRDKYEAFHRVKISDEAITAAVRLSQKYISDRYLPDKAVDLIDEAAASVRLPSISLPEDIKSLEDKYARLDHELNEAAKMGDGAKKLSITDEMDGLKKELDTLKASYQLKKSTTTNEVRAQDIADIVSRWTNIPVARLTESESEKLLSLEDLIHKKLIDQEEAVAAVSEAVRRGRAGLKSSKRPIGSFIFMGPTGVGKTELAKVLAELLFGSSDLMVRLDMTEYMEKHEVAKLIGAPPGYVGYEEGGQLTEAVRRRPYSVVLLDEIEKAHPDVFNILIQLLDDGRLTDNKGHTVSFKNTIVICTSNIGTGMIQQDMLGVEKASDSEKNGQTFKTYAISPSGREIVTLAEKFWEKDKDANVWKSGSLTSYFAGSVVKDGNNVFPFMGISTHLIVSDGSEMITAGDHAWFRTSTTAKEWIAGSLIEYFKDNVVINALPDSPDEQLPTIEWSTHAVSQNGEEIISYKDRFWRRTNAQMKDWTTGRLQEYFEGSKINNPITQSTNQPITGKMQNLSNVQNQGNFIQTDKQSKKEDSFPTKKWDVHLFSPAGEEIIISEGRYFKRKQLSNEWVSGAIVELFPVAAVLAGSTPLPLGGNILDVNNQEADEKFKVLSNKLIEELKKFFRPELLNRFDEVVVFKPLKRGDMKKIVGLQVADLAKLLGEQGIKIECSESATAHLAKEGYDPVYGARPLRRTVQRLIENPISSLLIKGELGDGDTVTVDFDGFEFQFSIKKNAMNEKNADRNESEVGNINQANENKKGDVINSSSGISGNNTDSSSPTLVQEDGQAVNDGINPTKEATNQGVSGQNPQTVSGQVSSSGMSQGTAVYTE